MKPPSEREVQLRLLAQRTRDGKNERARQAAKPDAAALKDMMAEAAKKRGKPRKAKKK